MTTILLTISLLLHVLAFYFIIVLYIKYSNLKALSETQRNILEETENTMTSFLIEIKDENERLIHKLKQGSLNNFDQLEDTEIISKHTHPVKTSTNSNEIQEGIPSFLSDINEIEDIIEISQSSYKKQIPFEIEAIKLKETGHTVEQIAKKLNKGKTEIELLLKFRQK